MNGARKHQSGEAGSVSTIRKRRRYLTDADALAIRDLKMLEQRTLDGLSNDAIALINGLSVRSVEDGIRRAKAAAKAARGEGED